MTEALRKQVLPAKLLQLQRDWASGAFMGAHRDATLQMNARAIGAADVIQSLLELDYEGMKGELEDGQ